MTDEWIKKMCIKKIHTHTHIYTMEYYSAINSEILLLVITWMDLESITLSEISHAEKYKHHMISFICGV